MVFISEFLAEASVLISPDLTAFRAKLLAELEVATRAIPPITVPVITTSSAANTQQLAAEVSGLKTLGAETQKLNAARVTSSGILAKQARDMSNLTRGVGVQALSFAGLRGAVLGANPAFIAGAAAALAFGAAVKSAADLQAELNVFRVTAGATASEMERVGAAATQLGADVSLPSVTAGSAAEAMTELARAGLSVQDSIEGARGVLQLATAAQLDNAAATTIAASALNAFNLSGDQAVHVADVLANAANQAQGGIDEIGIALQQSAAVARQAGLSLEQTATVLTILARNGLRGSDAGTSFRTSLIRLINPTTKAAAEIKNLNLQLRDSSGAIRLDVFDQFAQATRNMTAAQRDQSLAVIFGQDAIRAASILAREGVVGFAEVEQALNKQGTAAELAAARMAGLTGSTENLKNQLSALGLTVGQEVVPVLSALADGAAGTASEMNSLIADLVDVVRLGKEAAAIFPIDFGGGAEDDGGPPGSFDPSFLERLLPPQIKPFLDFRETVRFILSTTADEGREELKKLVDQLKATSGSPVDFNRTVVSLKELSRKLHDGNAEARKFGDGVDAFIGKLQELSVQPEIEPFELSIEIPPELLSGEVGRVAGDAAEREFKSAFDLTGSDFGFGSFIKTASDQGEVAGAGAAAAFNKSVRDAIASGTGRTNVLQGAALQIEIEGGPKEKKKLLANLDKQAEEARELIQNRTAQLKVGQVSSPALRDAQAELKRIQDQEDAIRDGIIADIKRSATEATQKAERDAREAREDRDKADQAVFNAFLPAQNRLDIAAITARADEGLKNDLALQLAIARQAGREIAAIDKTVKDMKTRNAEIAKRVTIIEGAAAEAKRLRAQIVAKATEDRRAASDVLTETLSKAITLAGLRENDAAELAAINKAIKNARVRVKNYKKLGLNLQDEQIALEQLINQRDEIEKTKKDADKGGTTAFDLLKQTAETFTANAGSLINASQPFAGPTGFTADLAQFLRRQQTVSPVTAPSGAAKGIALGDAGLIAALDRLRITIERQGKGNSSTATSGGGGGGGSLALNDNRFYESRVARTVVDSEQGGHGGV